MRATHKFTLEDQTRFATASGDFNPMHMDALAARRTQAGAPVVHGMHTLLHLLDYLGASKLDVTRIAGMKARFARMIYVGETIECRITDSDETSLRAEALVEGSPALAVKLMLGSLRPSPDVRRYKNASLLNPTEPCPLSIDEMAGRSGKLRLPETSVVAGMFPHVANFLGARRVAALACSSYLVGMVVPGLHSIYAGLSFDLCEDDCSEYAFFSVTLADPRFRLVSQDFVGGGVSARLETFVRMPPIRQAPMEAVIQCVEPNEFAGTIALIVGGSRGLGELTAKIIVAGGGRVIITYARGKADAENLATEIKRWGGNCEIIAYDVLNDSETPLSALRETPSQIYYYATPPVTPTRSGSFNNKAYDLFYNFYVDGFKQLVNSVLAQTRGKVAVFYPSSVFVDQAPAGMVEYATAKAEGEKLCAELMVQTPTLNVVTHRLPRMLTDLTATVQPVKMEDPLRILLPLVREITNSSRLQ